MKEIKEYDRYVDFLIRDGLLLNSEYKKCRRNSEISLMIRTMRNLTQEHAEEYLRIKHFKEAEEAEYIIEFSLVNPGDYTITIKS